MTEMGLRGKKKHFFLLWTIFLKCFVSELCSCFNSPLPLQEAPCASSLRFASLRSQLCQNLGYHFH